MNDVGKRFLAPDEDDGPQVLTGKGREVLKFISHNNPIVYVDGEPESPALWVDADVTYHASYTVPCDKAAQLDGMLNKRRKEPRQRFRPRIR